MRNSWLERLLSSIFIHIFLTMRYLFLIPLFFLLSCNKNDISENEIPGEWRVTEFDVDLYEMNETMEAIIENIALSTVYQFRKDGVWESTKDQGERQSGEWSYSEDSGELTLTSSSFEDDQTWVYKNDFKFEYIFENRNGKQKSVITKE